MNKTISELAFQMQQLFQDNNGLLSGGYKSITNGSSGSNPMRTTNQGGCINNHSCPSSNNSGACTNRGCLQPRCNASNGGICIDFD